MTPTNMLPWRHGPPAGPSAHPHRVIWLASLSLGLSAYLASVWSRDELTRSVSLSAEPASAAFGLERGCKAGDAIACNDLGVTVLNGDGMPVDHVLAFWAFERACQRGSADACSNLGALYERGVGTADSLERAAELYEKACSGGAGLGCSNLGALYARGRGVPRDLEEAQRLFQQACETGSAMGCSNLFQLARP